MAASTGIDRITGKILTDFAHVEQSLYVIFTTRIASRVMRRTFGSAVPALFVRNNLDGIALARFFAAIVLAIDLWEPRFRVTSIDFPADKNSATAERLGRFGIHINGLFYPYALQGNFTPDPLHRTVLL